jgi:hypothetical protein
MKTLDKEKYFSRFFGTVRKAQSRALLLDYDGTLASFKKEREKAWSFIRECAIFWNRSFETKAPAR